MLNELSGISPKIFDDPSVCDIVKDALRTFSEGEMATLCAVYNDGNMFVGIRCFYRGHLYKYADIDKAAAIKIIESHYVQELEELEGRIQC